MGVLCPWMMVRALPRLVGDFVSPPGAQLTRGGRTIPALALKDLGAQKGVLFHPRYFL